MGYGKRCNSKLVSCKKQYISCLYIFFCLGDKYVYSCTTSLAFILGWSLVIRDLFGVFFLEHLSAFMELLFCEYLKGMNSGCDITGRLLLSIVHILPTFPPDSTCSCIVFF